MTPDQAEIQVTSALYAVAPDIEGEAIDPTQRFRDQFEFDSMDFLRFILELHRRTGIDIPESDYPQLQSLTSAANYLRAKSATSD